MDQRRFVIPDVHGCATTLRRLVIGQLGLTRGDRLYLLGDLVDRGPDSKGVLDFLLDLRRRGYSVAAVRGNHEEMLLDACRDRSSFRKKVLTDSPGELRGRHSRPQPEAHHADHCRPVRPEKRHPQHDHNCRPGRKTAARG